MSTEFDEEGILTPQEEGEDLDTTPEESYEESVEEIKARLAKAEELANNYKIRAEKAERKSKIEEKEQKSEVINKEIPQVASTVDLYALSEAKVPIEDIADVEDYAKYKKISIAEALKTPALKSILQDKQEQRTIALATNTGGSKRSSGRLSDEALLERASKGVLPEDDETIQRLVKLQFSKKK